MQCKQRELLHADLLPPTLDNCLHQLTLCSANLQTVKSKTADLCVCVCVCVCEYIQSTDVDIFPMTETWLSDKDNAAKLEFILSETYKKFFSIIGLAAVSEEQDTAIQERQDVWREVII